MPNVISSLILGTTVVATIAVGVASASFINAGQVAAPRGDRLPVAVASADDKYVTIETRHDGVSVLNKILVN